MKESKFIKNNLERWETLSDDIQSNTLKDQPGKMSENFLKMGEDYSFSKTYYNSRSIKGVLNNFAAYLNLQFLNNKFKRKGLRYFFGTLLPYRLYNARKPLQISLITFLLFMVIGALSAEQEENLSFIRQILGDNYVDMTLENIKKGDPMYVYKDSDPITMQIYITFNNMYVALLSFVLGITGGLGSFYVLLKNGVMVGAFQYMFIKEGLGTESFLAIWMHGSTEIPAIILSGGAGLILAKGMFFPGHLKRIKSFQKSAREATSVFLGVTPLIIFAGFVESFLTRLTMLPDIYRLIFILSCFFFTIYYFYYLPYKRKKQGAFDSIVEATVSKEQEVSIQFYKVKRGPEVFSDAVNMYLKNWTTYFGLSIIFSIIICAGYLIELFDTPVLQEENIDSFSYIVDSLGYFFNDINQYFNIHQESLGPVLFILSIIICLWYVFIKIIRLEEQAPNRIPGVFTIKNKTNAGILSFASLFTILGLFFFLYNFIPSFVIRLLLVLPFLISISFSIHAAGNLKGINLGTNAFFSSFPTFLGFISLTCLIGFFGLFGFLILSDLFIAFLASNIDPSSILGQNFEMLISNFFSHFYMLNFIIFLALGVAQFIYIHKEKKEALSTLKMLDQFGKQENIRGLIRE